MESEGCVLTAGGLDLRSIRSVFLAEFDLNEVSLSQVLRYALNDVLGDSRWWTRDY